jgi:hypothetical protein
MNTGSFKNKGQMGKRISKQDRLDLELMVKKISQQENEWKYLARLNKGKMEARKTFPGLNVPHEDKTY